MIKEKQAIRDAVKNSKEDKKSKNYRIEHSPYFCRHGGYYDF
jgi:predicted Zn-ribbon and HTH transcriptional regulator